MNIAFITKEEISYDEAPPSRMLNLKKVLEKHHNVYILCKDSKINEKGIYTLPLKSKNFITHQIYKILMSIYCLYFLLTKKIDYFITREYHYIIFLYPFTRLTNTKIIYDMHCYRHKELKVEKRWFKSYIIKLIELLAHRLADNICIISNGLFEDLPPKIMNKAFLLPNGVELNDFKDIKIDEKVLKKYKIPDNKKIIGFIGNWMEWVDVPTLLKSAQFYSKDMVLLIVGKCYENISIDQLRKEYPEVIFTGRIPHKEALQLLKKMNICVLPYKNVEVIKHLSIRKTMEYLATGKPIIMSDSNIGEKDFLKENKNVVKYQSGNVKDLALKAKMLLRNKKLMKKLSVNNLKISKAFSWERQILDSELLEKVGTYDTSKIRLPQAKISIIIKALNEEKHIAKCIESALDALKGLNGEIILVDSKSTDKTMEIAKKYPIKIIQLKKEEDKCCGIGPQTGYLYSKGDYVYILDGDMTIDKVFIKKALPYLNYRKIGGIGGNIIEKSEYNLAFQVRKKHHIVSSVREVYQLGMGGLYKKEALEKIGYFSNPYFYAYEEYDLGAKLLKERYKLLRIPQKMVEHYGDETTSIQTLKSRWKSKYLFGSGQYLRVSIPGRHFLKTLFELKIYVFTLFWFWVGIISLLSLIKTSIFFNIYFITTTIFIIVLALIRRNLQRTIFSLFSWNFQAVGMFMGFFIGIKNPLLYKPNVKIIKNG